MEKTQSMIKVCDSCKNDDHEMCRQRHILGVRCDCKICHDEFEKTLRINDVEVTHDGRCLRVRIGNTTTHLDVRDLYHCPSWLDRKDNREETLQQIKKDIEDDKNE